MADFLNKSTRRIVHGALDYGELERLGLHGGTIRDFSVNANPYGPSPRVREALEAVAIDRYPDRECLQLRRAILTYELDAAKVPLSSLVCGNGTSELIWAIAHAYLKPGLKAAILGPTFGEYLVASQAVGATVVEFRAQQIKQFGLDTAAVVTWIEREQPSLLWLCNPNNPTGFWLNQQSIHRIAEACQRIDVTLVIDEAYWHLVFPAEPFSAVELVNEMPRVLVLRSLTKDFALAGLRLGYMVADADAVEQVSAYLPSWNVNAAAQAAGVAALTDRPHRETTLDALAVERREFFQALEHAGFKVVPSRTHFCLVEVGNASRVRHQLLTRRMLVRDCTSFGLPQFIRVATRQRSEWQPLISALKETV